MATVKSQFIDVASRRVLVRYSGTGPCGLLLHQSPQTSRSLLPWIVRLAKRDAAIAPTSSGVGVDAINLEAAVKRFCCLKVRIGK